MYFFGGGDAQLNPEPPNNQNSQRWFPCCQPFVMLWFFTTIGNHHAYFLGYTLLRRKGIVFNDLWMSKFSAGKICNSGLVRVLNQLEIWCKNMFCRCGFVVSSHWRCGMGHSNGKMIRMILQWQWLWDETTGRMCLEMWAYSLKLRPEK